MSSKWGGLLAHSHTLQRFDVDLRAHLAQDYEVDDDLVAFVISSTKEAQDKQQLAAEFTETFEDDAVDIAAWCWDKLSELAQQKITTADTAKRQDEPSEEGEVADEQHAGKAREDQHPSRKFKREPIKFSLESTAANTAPVKASVQKSQQLQPNNATEAPTASKAEQQPEQHDTGRSRQPQQQASRGAAAVVKGALAAAARSTAAADTKVDRDGVGNAKAADSRERSKRREATPPAEAVQASNTAHAGQASSQVREQRDSRAAVRSRDAKPSTVGIKRSLHDVAGARGLASRALQQIGAVAAGASAGGRTDRAVKRQQQVQQQQQQIEHAAEQPSHRVSVLDRLGSRESQEVEQKGASKQSVFERLSGISPDSLNAQAQPKQHLQAAVAAQQNIGRSKANLPVEKAQEQQQQQKQQHQQQLIGTGIAHAAAQPRKSLASRLQGAGTGAVEPQQEQQNKQQAQPGSSNAATAAGEHPSAAPTTTAGSKRKAPAAPGANGSAANSGAASKKPATATAAKAAASSAKQQPSAELAALRAMLAAKEAEVKRLQQLKAQQEQQQEADERSIVVFNLAPHIPEAVVRAHFSGCGTIKRCTLLPGRLPGPSVPGAYIEFESTMGVLAAMGLAGSSLINLQIQVARKSDYQANLLKGKQTYAALRAQAAAPGGKSWVKPVAVPAAAAGPVAGGSTGGGGDLESPTSLGSMGLAE